MKKEKLLTMGLIVLLGIVSMFCAGNAEAKPEQGRQGPPDGEGPGNRPLHGEILSISTDEIVIAPSIPKEMLERMEERGVEPPSDLPAEIVIALGDKTRFMIGGEQGTITGFAVGDSVVIAVRRGEDGPVAIAVADIDSAIKFMQKKFKGSGKESGQQEFGPDRQAGKGQGGPGGEGRDGQGGPGQQGRGRPAFGEVTAINGDSITIRPEVPEFVLEQMAQRGHEPPGDLPESLTFTIDGETRYIVAGDMQEANPFATGDKVAVMIRGTGGEGTALGIADYETVMDRLDGRGDDRERGKKERRDPNKRGHKPR